MGKQSGWMGPLPRLHACAARGPLKAAGWLLVNVSYPTVKCPCVSCRSLGPAPGGGCEVNDELWRLAVDQVLVKLVDSETQVGLPFTSRSAPVG